MDDLLTTGQLSEVSGDKEEKRVPARTLRAWVAAGHLTPFMMGKGTGLQHRWSAQQALIVAYVQIWREWGASPFLIFSTLRTLSELPEREMLAAFKRGKTHLAGAPSKTLVKPANGVDLDHPATKTRVYLEATAGGGIGYTIEAIGPPAKKPDPDLAYFDLAKVHREVTARIAKLAKAQARVPRTVGRRRGLA